jgi:hypothetical protein
MDINYLVKQNGTMQVLFNNYKFCRTPHAPTKHGSLSYKCRVDKCGVTIKIKDKIKCLNQHTPSSTNKINFN